MDQPWICEEEYVDYGRRYCTAVRATADLPDCLVGIIANYAAFTADLFVSALRSISESICDPRWILFTSTLEFDEYGTFERWKVSFEIENEIDELSFVVRIIYDDSSLTITRDAVSNLLHMMRYGSLASWLCTIALRDIGATESFNLSLCRAIEEIRMRVAITLMSLTYKA
jgi:hypothetical protein